jgi:hypothetical protein
MEQTIQVPVLLLKLGKDVFGERGSGRALDV